MDVKPWEPVEYEWMFARSNFKQTNHHNDFDSDMWWCLSAAGDAGEILEKDALSVTLANGQRIIVRVLSDERKAARREAKAEELQRLKSMLAYVMDSDPDGFSKAVSQ